MALTRTAIAPGATLVSESVRIDGSKVSPRIACGEEETGGCKGTAKIARSTATRSARPSTASMPGRAPACRLSSPAPASEDVEDAGSMTTTVLISTKEPNGKTLRRDRLEIRDD